MLRPSYNQLINKANENAPENEPVVRSRYSIVLAAAKRARQLVDGNKTYVNGDVRKPLSLAVAELNEGKVKILPEGAAYEDYIQAIEETAETVEAVEEAVDEANEVEEEDTEEDTEEVDAEETNAEETDVEEIEEAIAVESEEIQL